MPMIKASARAGAGTNDELEVAASRREPSLPGTCKAAVASSSRRVIVQ